jgi:Rad3-related DNA helicase
VLVSPSYQIGWDFPRTDCEYQILIKVPFPNTQSAVIEARCQDTDYRLNYAMQLIVQMRGRGLRDACDRCEFFILDDKVGYLFARGARHKPDWVQWWTVNYIPPAPPKL